MATQAEIDAAKRTMDSAYSAYRAASGTNEEENLRNTYYSTKRQYDSLLSQGTSTSGTSTTTTTSSGSSTTGTTNVASTEGSSITSGSAVTEGIPTTTDAMNRNELVGDRVVTNLDNPDIPKSAIQTSTDIYVKSGETLNATDPRFMMNTGSNVGATTGTAAGNVSVGSLGTSTYTAANTGYAGTSGVTGKLSSGSIMDAAQGEITSLMKAAQGTASPEDFMTAAQADINAGIATAAIKNVTPEELVSYQMEKLTQGLESGDIPLWARPAVDAVEGQLAARGLSRSSVGQASLTNAIIQAAMPMAQQNAQTYFQRTESNLNRQQQTNLQNAQSKLSLTMANLSAENQARLANSQFMQTLKLTNLGNEQQAAITNAQNLASMDMANLNAAQQAAVQNAQAFLQMDMTNLSNRQQAAIVTAQNRQQSMLTNAAAQNAARQFNASSINQTNQFMKNLGAQVQMNNAARRDAMSQFNVGQVNAMKQFNQNLRFQADQFNSQNATAIAQSNVQWRRQVNQINTASKNAVNQANAMNAFNLSNQSMTFMWQELRDAAKWSFEASQNDLQRAAALAQAALGNESVSDTKRASYLVDIGKAALNFWLQSRS